MRTLIGLLLLPALVAAATRSVAPGESIQAAIVAATAGDVVQVAGGTYVEDIDFLGKAITVAGIGPETIVRGTGVGPVVRFATGETRASVLDSLTITGGIADEGGGVLVIDASPTIQRTVIADNAARRQGSGVYLQGGAARLANNLIVRNRTVDPLLGDAHSVQLLGSSAELVNNTIAFGDSNGILMRGTGTPVVLNNVIARNGSRVNGNTRGRGICDFSADGVIQYNVFYRNRKAALLTAGEDFRLVRTAERALGRPRLTANLDGSPRFVDARRGDFGLRTPSRARNAGHPDPAFANGDGTRNTIGFTGGPLAPAWGGAALRAAARTVQR